MNAILKLWSVLSGLADSLSRTKELIDLGNARMEQSLGLTEPLLKLDGPEKSAKRAKGATE